MPPKAGKSTHAKATRKAVHPQGSKKNPHSSKKKAPHINYPNIYDGKKEDELEKLYNKLSNNIDDKKQKAIYFFNNLSPTINNLNKYKYALEYYDKLVKNLKLEDLAFNERQFERNFDL